MTEPVPQNPDPSIPAPPPEMTRLEASFHASVAGARAAEEARAQGCDPARADALGLAACGGRSIGGLVLPLPGAYSALSIPRLGRLFELHGIVITGIQSDCAFVAAFAHPERVYRLAAVQADQSAAEELVGLADETALALMTRERIDEAVDWCREAFERLNGVKKPSPAPEATAPEPKASPTVSPPVGAVTAQAGSSSSSMP